MKHAGSAALAEIDGLLDRLRKLDWLNERSPGTFYRGSRSFLHFHEDPTGVYADVRLDVEEGFVRVRTTTRVEQDALMRRVREAA